MSEISRLIETNKKLERKIKYKDECLERYNKTLRKLITRKYCPAISDYCKKKECVCYDYRNWAVEEKSEYCAHYDLYLSGIE